MDYRSLVVRVVINYGPQCDLKFPARQLAQGCSVVWGISLHTLINTDTEEERTDLYLQNSLGMERSPLSEELVGLKKLLEEILEGRIPVEIKKKKYTII